jgi:glycosyltransferase involved in cell wall biosynthesis
VIPAWKSDAVLGAALRSVAEQSLLPAEVVVVDDGSPEGDLGAVVARSPLPVRLIRAPHGGPSRARNRGVAETTAPWIAFLDADDTWEPAKLERQWQLVRGAPAGPAMVSCDWLRPGEAAPGGRGGVAAHPAGYREILWRNAFQTSTALVAREAFTAAGGFNPDLDGAEDWDMWLRVAAQGLWLHLREPLVRYLDNPAGVSKDLVRVYRNGRVMLERYLRGEGDPRIVAAVGMRHLVWHDLRFGWAFDRIGARTAARECYAAAWQPGRRALAAEVAATRLLPFIAGRLLRRVRRAGA